MRKFRRRLWTCERCGRKVEILGLDEDGKHTCGECGDIVEEIKKCEFRALEYTKGCGGAVYWWCNKDNKQINIYEDCKKCKVKR